MKHLILFGASLFVFSQCSNPIKNEATTTIEEGTSITTPSATTQSKVEEPTPKPTATTVNTQEFLGYWVGDFENGTEDRKEIWVGEGFYWNRENKINLSIDKITGNQVIGHSVVAGNDRPFEGTMQLQEDGSYAFEVKEPGDDKYDGVFKFVIKDQTLKGEWKAYKKLDIDRRVYELEKKSYAYNPDIMLSDTEGRYIDWSKSKKEKRVEDYGDGEVEEWIENTYSTATEAIYQLNASNTLLTKEQVENLKRGDLIIIRNTIYARHGYSFKKRPLRVFFDAQEWYIPAHADIRADFTELEKKNIDLLLRYEGNAEEYYDRFGRG